MNKITPRLKFTLIYINLFFLAAPLQGEIFRWVDKQGQVHFSDADNLPKQVQHADTVDVEPNIVEVRPGLSATRKPRRDEKKPSNNNRIDKSADIITRLQQDQVKCRLARENLNKVRQRLRAGYSARQYRRLHEREIRYMDDRTHYCH